MKKLFFLMFMTVGLMAGNARAQTDTTTVVPTTVVYDYGYSANNQDTFTYYVTSDGYLHYSLIDNGPGGDNYESIFGVSYIDPSTNYNAYIAINQPGGGSIIGSVYIGTTNQTLYTLEHGAGYITGDDAYEAEAWDVYVDFGK